MRQNILLSILVNLLLISLSVTAQDEQDTSSKTDNSINPGLSSDQAGNEEGDEEEQTTKVNDSPRDTISAESDSRGNQETTGSNNDKSSPSSMTPENVATEIPISQIHSDGYSDSPTTASTESHVDGSVTKKSEVEGVVGAHEANKGAGSEAKPYAANPPFPDGSYNDQHESNTTRVEYESFLKDVNKLEGTNSSTTLETVTIDSTLLSTKVSVPSPSAPPSLALEEHSISSLEIPDIKSYGVTEEADLSESSVVPTHSAGNESVSVSSSHSNNPTGTVIEDTSLSGTSNLSRGTTEASKENLPVESATSFMHPSFSDVISKPYRKSRSEIPETHHRDLFYLVVRAKDFDVFNWVDSKDQSLRFFIASKLQEHRNHSFTDGDVLYIGNSPRVGLDTLFIEMGIIDHEFRHGLHLYPGDRVVDTIASQNVTDEMRDRLSLELMTVTTDEARARIIFHQSQKGSDEQPLISSMIVRGDMVLFILILAFISTSIVIFVFICYCCRRKGKNLFGNHNSSSSVQLPTGTTSPQEFNLRTLDRIPPLYTCYDLNPAADILREEKCINDRGSNLSINFPVNGNSVTLLKNHYPEVQMNRRSSSHTGLHKIHVNEAWIQVLPPNSLEKVHVVRKYSKTSTDSSSSSNPELREEGCSCNDEPSTLNVRIQNRTSFKNTSEDTGRKQRNSSQMVSFVTLNGMKDTKL